MSASPIDLIPAINSSPEMWIEWYQELKSAYGKDSARQLWIKAWTKRGGVSSPANTDTLRQAMSKEGINVDKSAVASLVDFTEGIGSGVGDLFSTIGGIAKWTTIAVIAVVVIGGGLIIYNIARNPNATLKAVKK